VRTRAALPARRQAAATPRREPTGNDIDLTSRAICVALEDTVLKRIIAALTLAAALLVPTAAMAAPKFAGLTFQSMSLVCRVP
jgi:hypothetical protein